MKTGVVMKSTGTFYRVMAEDGSLVQCRMKGSIRLKGYKSTNPAVVGDLVDFSVSETTGEGMIEVIRERRNYIVRKSIKLSSQKHILAANIDQVLLFVTLSQPKTHLEFIDRFLVTAEAYHIPAILLFNKIDLYSDKEMQHLDELSTLYEKIGYTCIRISALRTENLSNVRNVFRNKTTLISGHSGVGKSTLINRIAPELNLKTSAISDYHKSGKHTTTYAEMFNLPDLGFIIDTPGIKGMGVLDIPKEEISHYFPEMRKALPDCKYNNCIHLDEPDCAVKKAVESGDITASRYRSYLSLINEEDGDHYRTPDYT